MTRDENILEAVREAAYAPFDWAPVRSESYGRVAIFYVTPDAMKLNGVRVMASATLLQRIADVMGAHLLTPKLCDLMHWSATVAITPCIQPQPPHPGQPHMNSPEAEALHSAAVDAKVAGRPGLVSTPCKDWVLSRRVLAYRHLAANYGWYDHKAPYETHYSDLRLWQPLSTRHNDQHMDYSQGVRLVRGDCLLDGVPTDVASIMSSEPLSGLISWDGVVPTRMPDVPYAV